jgi:dolichol kinase
VEITSADLRGAAVIAVTFFLLLLIAELWSRLGTPKPEWTRKLVHLGGGVIGLFLPFLIESPLVVFVLTVSLSLIFAIGGKTKLLKSLHGVERTSRGSEYYPLAIFLVFVIAASRPWLYISAVLVLAMADAFAALIGSRYGVIRYQVEEEYKSVEGSVVFFFIAFMAVHLPMLLMTEIPRPVCVLAALLVALLVTGFEAISLHGTDNLFVPIAVCFVLQKITTKPLSEIVYQNLSLIGIVAVIAFIAWRFESFNAGGALAVILFTFATWSLGSRRWAVPVILGIAAYSILRWQFAARPRHGLRVRIISHALLVPFLVLLCANLTGRYSYFYAPYLAAAASVLSFALWDGGVRLSFFSGKNRFPVAASIGIAAAVLITMTAWFSLTLSSLVPVVAVVMMFSIVNAAIHFERRAGDVRARGWSGASFTLALLAAATVVAVQSVLKTQSW